MDLEAGSRYGYGAPPRRPGAPLRPVEFLRAGPPRSQRVRVRWLDGEFEGLEEWVPKRRLLVAWAEVEAFLEDEHGYAAVLAASQVSLDSTERAAVETVWLASPRELGSWYLDGRRCGGTVLVINDLPDVAAAMRGPTADELLAEPLAFVDREDRYIAPFPVAARLARLACTRCPHEILEYVAKEEKRWEDALVRGYMEDIFGKDVLRVRKEGVEERLRELRPVHNMVREWCGVDAQQAFDELGRLRAENERLVRIIEDAARFLKDAGHNVKASLVLREVRGVPVADPAGRGRGRPSAR